jgi:hypothetical protein
MNNHFFQVFILGQKVTPPSAGMLSLKTILHRRHFPLGGHVTTATRETTSNQQVSYYDAG